MTCLCLCDPVGACPRAAPQRPIDAAACITRGISGPGMSRLRKWEPHADGKSRRCRRADQKSVSLALAIAAARKRRTRAGSNVGALRRRAGSPSAAIRQRRREAHEGAPWSGCQSVWASSFHGSRRARSTALSVDREAQSGRRRLASAVRSHGGLHRWHPRKSVHTQRATRQKQPVVTS